MSREIIIEASASQLIAAHLMPIERALALSRQLAEVAIPIRGYYPNNGWQYQDLRIQGEAPIDVGRTVYELGVRLSDEPQHDPRHIVAPYFLPGLPLIRGLALWRAQSAVVPARVFNYPKALLAHR